MADYNLHGLNNRDFQHLVQAIARKAIAVGVTSFGDGKDGARDLTFTGRMDYPSKAAPWDGYLVAGCKFQQRPTGEARKDADWAIKHLELDLKKFVNKKRKLPKPDYYLFVTNARLSAAADSGGRDSVENKLRQFAEKLSLKGYGVWDYNDLRGFLDADSDLRAAYGHFITSGDVLAKMMDVLKPHRADFVDVMTAFLQKELIADMSAKLQSAGEDPESQIALANVFVDLPFVESAEVAALAFDSVDLDKLPNVVETLLNAGSSVLRTVSQEVAGTSGPTVLHRNESRFVIIGGPGQGKSTFGQYLCQLYRAAIIRDRPPERLDAQVPSILIQLKKQRTDAGGLPLARRFPIRIELRNFALALTDHPERTLLQYIKHDIARLSNSDISLDDLKSWLGQYPWLVVLDGLDEVPPSSNRGEVLKEIESFRVDAASQNADLMIVATTRPQSYSKEFSSDLFHHLYLTPLSPVQALRYGTKLAEARCGADVRRKDELVKSLQKACEYPATSRLMQSPLQVTIMATLLEGTGEPPQQRYRLFQEYYRTIYRRETRRKLLGGILTERQKDIDTIHAQTGLILHAAGEQIARRPRKPAKEEVDSALSDKQFRELVEKRLEQIGISPSRILELLDRISDGSLQRLVFLVRPREGWVRFDITSLKEFMAAEAVVNGSDDDIRARMEVIAPASYWRNVFLFAVGKCFFEREHLLDCVVSLCTGLNEERSGAHIIGDALAGRAAMVVLWGSRLALDILLDGTARQYPGYEIRFARIALRLVQIGDAESSAQLAAVFHDDFKSAYLEEIQDRLGQKALPAQLGGWLLLKSLADRGTPWALRMLNEQWPADTSIQLAMLSVTSRRSLATWADDKVAALIPNVDSNMVYHLGLVPLNQSRLKDAGKLCNWAPFLSYLYEGKRRCIIANRSFWNAMIPQLWFNPMHLGPEIWDSIKNVEFLDPSWIPVVAGVRFGANPSAKVLSAELRFMAEKWSERLYRWIPAAPWPITACLCYANSKEELLRLADAAERLQLGDTKEWSHAEHRWQTVGLVDEDFSYDSGNELPFSREIAVVGFPFFGFHWPVNDAPIVSGTMKALGRLHEIQNVRTSSWLAFVILSQWQFGQSRKVFPPPSVFRELLGLASRLKNTRLHGVMLDDAMAVVPEGLMPSEWVDFFDSLGRDEMNLSLNSVRPDVGRTLIHHFCAEPERYRGLLHIIAEMAESGFHCLIEKEILALAKTWSPRDKIVATSLELSGQELDEAQLISVSKELLESKGSRFQVWRALRIARSCSLGQAANLALAIMKVTHDATDYDVEVTSHTRETLNAFLTNRPSRLQDPDVWRRLHFPERPSS